MIRILLPYLLESPGEKALGIMTHYYRCGVGELLTYPVRTTVQV